MTTDLTQFSGNYTAPVMSPYIPYQRIYSGFKQVAGWNGGLAENVTLSVKSIYGDFNFSELIVNKMDTNQKLAGAAATERNVKIVPYFINFSKSKISSNYNNPVADGDIDAYMLNNLNKGLDTWYYKTLVDNSFTYNEFLGNAANALNDLISMMDLARTNAGPGAAIWLFLDTKIRSKLMGSRETGKFLFDYLVEAAKSLNIYLIIDTSVKSDNFPRAVFYIEDLVLFFGGQEPAMIGQFEDELTLTTYRRYALSTPAFILPLDESAKQIAIMSKKYAIS